MNINDKLDYFMSVSVETAQERYNKSLEKYKAKLDHIFEDHKKEALRKAELSEKIAIDNIERSSHKALSHEQVNIKREFSLQIEKLTDNLFNEVTDRLEEYKKTPDYYNLLLSQIKDAIAFSKGNDVVIYIDPDDSQYLEKLSADSNFELLVSSYSFMGGTKCVIQSKNILIDNSFKAKLSEARQQVNIGY